MNTADVLEGAPVRAAGAPLSVELPDDPAARLSEWLARSGHAGAYERFVALAVEVFPPGTTFENTLEMHEGGEYVVECVATVPATTNPREHYNRFVARWIEYPQRDIDAPLALSFRWSEQ
jgi:hypothetical protein